MEDLSGEGSILMRFMEVWRVKSGYAVGKMVEQWVLSVVVWRGFAVDFCLLQEGGVVVESSWVYINITFLPNYQHNYFLVICFLF